MAPDMVQIGNEVTPGMLWPDGRVDGEFDRGAQWRVFAGLLQAGASAVRAVCPGARVMIHIDRGGDWETTRKFFGKMEELGVDYDVIGQSFYPWWHGMLDDLRRNLALTAETFRRPIVVVETAYPWTLRKYGEPDLIVEREDQLAPGYPASVEGQSAYLRDFLRIVRETPGGLGLGFYWWEPAWIPAKPVWSVGHPNNWANLTLFDYDGHRLSTWDVLREEER
jgi:arabinogalactan endo-1,4-beta-galactosidase